MEEQPSLPWHLLEAKYPTHNLTHYVRAAGTRSKRGKAADGAKCGGTLSGVEKRARGGPMTSFPELGAVYKPGARERGYCCC